MIDLKYNLPRIAVSFQKRDERTLNKGKKKRIIPVSFLVGRSSFRKGNSYNCIDFQGEPWLVQKLGWILVQLTFRLWTYERVLVGLGKLQLDHRARQDHL